MVRRILRKQVGVLNWLKARDLWMDKTSRKTNIGKENERKIPKISDLLKVIFLHEPTVPIKYEANGNGHERMMHLIFLFERRVFLSF